MYSCSLGIPNSGLLKCPMSYEARKREEEQDEVRDGMWDFFTRYRNEVYRNDVEELSL